MLDKIDQDRAIEVYADMLNAPPDMLVANDQVAAVRQQRAQQQQQLQAAEMAMTVAKGAKVLSETDVGAGVSALQRMTGMA